MEINIDLLVKCKLTPNSYTYLYYLVKKEVCPIPLSIDKLTLEKRGFLKIMNDGEIPRMKAIRLFDEVEATYSTPKETIVITNDVEKWIQEWRELFPKGIKTGGYPVRGSRSGSLKKMKAFMNANKSITKEQVFQATINYVAEKEANRYNYMKMADYFIMKEGVSMLESYIDQLSETTAGAYDQQTNNLVDDI